MKDNVKRLIAIILCVVMAIGVCSGVIATIVVGA